MANRKIHDWTVTRGDGVVAFAKDGQRIETTYDGSEDGAADVAYEHALAQAYAADHPDHDLGGKTTDQQWRTIRAWEREG